MSTITIPVHTSSRAYDVLVGPGVLDQVGEVCARCAGGTVAAVISDSNVAPLYGQRVLSSLERAGYRTALLTFPAGEQNKRLSTL